MASILLYRVLLLRFPFDEHLECLEVRGIAIKTAVNIDMYVFGIIYTFKNLGYLGLIASICGRYIYIYTRAHKHIHMYTSILNGFKFFILKYILS